MQRITGRYFREQTQQALQIFNKALNAAGSISDDSDKASALSGIVVGLAKAGQTQKALQIFDKAVNAAGSITRDYSKASALRDIPVELAKAGQFDKAINLINKKTTPYNIAYILISIHQGYMESNKKLDDNCKRLLEDISAKIYINKIESIKPVFSYPFYIEEIEETPIATLDFYESSKLEAIYNTFQRKLKDDLDEYVKSATEKSCLVGVFKIDKFYLDTNNIGDIWLRYTEAYLSGTLKNEFIKYTTKSSKYSLKINEAYITKSDLSSILNKDKNQNGFISLFLNSFIRDYTVEENNNLYTSIFTINNIMIDNKKNFTLYINGKLEIGEIDIPFEINQTINLN